MCDRFNKIIFIRIISVSFFFTLSFYLNVIVFYSNSNFNSCFPEHQAKLEIHILAVELKERMLKDTIIFA